MIGISETSDRTPLHSRERIAYEALLANCCHYDGILTVLNQHRPYFESLPSIRRLQESMVIIPLPSVRSREVTEVGGQLDTQKHIRPLACDIAVMMCDPEWKIKIGIEIVLFIQRPGEEFSDLLKRWRQTQQELGQGVEWLMPRQHKHLLSEGTEEPHPLFVVFAAEGDCTASSEDLLFDSSEGATESAAERAVHGLKGAGLPFAIQPLVERRVERRSQR